MAQYGQIKPKVLPLFTQNYNSQKVTLCELILSFLGEILYNKENMASLGSLPKAEKSLLCWLA